MSKQEISDSSDMKHLCHLTLSKGIYLIKLASDRLIEVSTEMDFLQVGTVELYQWSETRYVVVICWC
jgi:hypothetical protein